MDYRESETDEQSTCVVCGDSCASRDVRDICVDCLFDVRAERQEAYQIFSRFRDLLGRSHGIRPTIVLLMALTWLAVTLMESLL